MCKNISRSPRLPVWYRAATRSAASSSALLVAAFSHVYIWIHYFATEKPDMQYLYGNPGASES